jgi:hypothetical protein
MSNIFKKNSRFAILAEDISTTNKEINKNNNNTEDKFKNLEKSIKGKNSLKKTYQENEIKLMEEKKIKEEKEKLKNDKLLQSLSIDNFPELFSKNIKKELSSSTYTSFLDKLKTSDNSKKENQNIIDIDEEYENLKPGWMIIKRDLLTGQKKIKTKPYLTSLNIKPEKTQQEIAYDVLDTLCELHEKRTKEYIELYGYDNWEETFIYKNYDYQWVDKLDEQYEKEMMAEIMAEMVFFENEYE